MKPALTFLFLIFSLFSFSQNISYSKAWDALNQNNRTEAEQLFREAQGDPASGLDAYISNLYLQTYNGKEKALQDFGTAISSKATNPYPYIFALWFNQAVAGEYGKKRFEHQVKLLDNLIGDEKAPGTINASANYQKGMHLLFSNEFEKAQKNYDAIGNLRNWQYVGPFENLSESGIYKSYGPLEKPEPQSVFKSISNADVKWFTPTNENKDGWIPLTYQFANRTAVIYAQTFVQSSSDQSILLNAGFSGAVKVWLNDQLLITETKERATEMDAYSARCNLKKGANRILVQISFTNSNYPNFNIRFTDDRYKLISGLTGSADYVPYNKQVTSQISSTLVPHFAEAFFKTKIESEKTNLVNYLLLTDVLMRNNKVLEAREVITQALLLAPENSVIRRKLIEVLIKENNRTAILEELEKIKKADPLSLAVLDLNIKEFFDNEKFEDGAAELKKRIALHGENESTDGYNILLLGHEKKYEEIVKEAERLFKKYDGNAQFVKMMYSIKKDVYKDNKAALKVYENFMKNNFNYDIYEEFSNLLSEQGSTGKALGILEDLANAFPYNPYGYHQLSKYHFGAKQYEKAEEYIKKCIELAPYNETYWDQLGDIKSEKNNKAEALEAYNQSLKFDPKQYTTLSKIRKLNNLPEVFKLFPQPEIDEVIKNDKQEDARNTDYGFYFILDQKDVVLYPGGATEEFITNVIKITNDKGVDKYKESSIWYNNSQSLLIEKAEIIKKNKARIEGERNENEVVFTNLEVGDVVVFKYRLQSYVYGRFAKEYWDRFYFGSQIYTSIGKYHLLVPADQKIFYTLTESKVQPQIKDVENYKQYSWEMSGLEPLKDEPFMPLTTDIGAVLHVSTVPDWKEIANWYGDLSNNKAEEDFEIISLFKKLFPDSKKHLSQFEKARIIYDHLEANIRYSSVSFRQSAYVPQRPSETLNTRLGDCKDMSSLFVTLAQMAGINSQMVLVNTRNNGVREMMLPSVEFNHCIAKAVLDNKPYYIELTDNYLPFASLPNNLNGASILEIPYRVNSIKSELINLKAINKTKDTKRRVIDIYPEGSDLSVEVQSTLYGNSSSTVRNTYANLDEKSQKLEMEKIVARAYKNNVKLNNVSFKDIEKKNDSLFYKYSYKVKNEIAEIGTMNTFRITYPDIVASLDNFSADERIYPIEYWSYEDVDSYETVVNIAAPAGKKFVELPLTETLTFKDMKFSINYTLKSPGKLVVTRKFSSNRQNISAADYIQFKAFFEKIVKAEQKFITYK